MTDHDDDPVVDTVFNAVAGILATGAAVVAVLALVHGQPVMRGLGAVALLGGYGWLLDALRRRMPGPLTDLGIAALCASSAAFYSAAVGLGLMLVGHPLTGVAGVVLGLSTIVAVFLAADSTTF